MLQNHVMYYECSNTNIHLFQVELITN